MSEAQDPKSVGPGENPESASPVTHTDKPSLKGEQPKRFKLKVSLPGQDIGGEWLCRATNEALVSRNYCNTKGTPREFTTYLHSDNKTYLHDQEGNWLTTTWDGGDLLWMSSFTRSRAWKIEGNRLIREEDGALLTWKPGQHYAQDRGKYYLSANPKSEYTLTVERVEV